MLGMKNHFDISGSIEIREVDCICEHYQEGVPSTEIQFGVCFSIPVPIRVRD